MKKTILFLMFLYGFTSFAQTNVSGTVKDENGEPLPGVSILVKGLGKGTITDFDGIYNLQNLNANNILEFTYQGFKPQEVKVGDQNQINVSLKESSEKLDEVVVIGFGSVAKKDVTGSVASVSIKELSEAPVTRFDDALAGRVTGLQVSNGGTGGEPGAAKKIVIRGQNSISSTNDPLYVVDGFMVPNFDASQIDPSDIESISVLKDASATAIYGANGANGVIIITSKKTTFGKTKVSYETRLDVKNVSKKLELLDGYDYVKLFEELNSSGAKSAYLNIPNPNGGGTLPVVGANYEKYKTTESRDWQDEAFRTAFSKTHRIKISGGTEQTRMRASVNSVSDQGTLLKSLYEKTDGRITINQKVNDKLNATVDLSYQHYVQNGVNVNGTNQYSFLRSLITYRPTANAYIDYGDNNPLDQINTDPLFGDLTNTVIWHPIVSLKNEYNRRGNDRFNSNFGLKYKFNKALTLETKNSYNYTQRKIEVFNNSETVYGRIINAINGINGLVTNDTWRNYSTSNTLSYKKKFGDHSLKALLGLTLDVRKRETGRYGSNQIPQYVESLGINSLSYGTPNSNKDAHADQESRIYSYLGRLNYSYKGRYLLTSSIRRDASSRFSQGKNAAYFPSLALSWRADKEDFIKDLGVFSQLKLKAGYGKIGNERIDNNARYNLLTSENADYSVGGSLSPGLALLEVAGNPDLVWETTSMVNAGIDLGLFNDRLTVLAEIYQKDTRNLLFKADVGPSVGSKQKWVNSGDMRNRGLELTFNSVNISTDNFKWTSGFNISFNQNTVVSLPKNKPLFIIPKYYQNFETQQYLIEEGKSLGNMYGYISDGVYQTKDFVNYDPTSPSHTLKGTEPFYRSQQPGDEKYKDLNHDGKIDDNDKTIIGNGLAKHFGGFNNSFEYKNFSLGTFFQWSYGNDILNANKLLWENHNDPGKNQLATVKNRWTPENQNTDMYRAGGQGFRNDISSRLVEDGSYLRLKTVNLSYKFNKSVLDKLKVSSLSMTLAAQNLITWTNYSGYDPDVSVISGAVAPGVDFSAYPNSKIYSFSLKLTL